MSRGLAVLLPALAGWVLAAPNPAVHRLVAAGSSSRTADAPRRGRGLLATYRRRRTADQRRAALHDLLAVLAAELRTGAAPRDVLAGAAALRPDLSAVAAAARQPAGDPVRALATLGQHPGAEAAADLAVVWRVSEVTGCSLVGPVGRLLVAHRAGERTRRELAAQLAGPRATARLLASLPVGGLGLGHALGAHPLGFLLGSSAGIGCLVAGAALVAAGLLWTRAVVTSVAGSAR